MDSQQRQSNADLSAKPRPTDKSSSRRLLIKVPPREKPNSEAAALISAIKPLLPAPPPGTPGPFALSDENAIREFATKAALEPIEIFDVQADWSYPNKDTAFKGLLSAGVATRAIEHSSEEAVNSAYAEALKPFLSSNGGYQIEAIFRCLLTQA